MTQVKTFPRLEIHIVNHCNLNCCACAHFSNICSDYYMDLVQFQNDLSEITKKINYKLINILGGEPLLHPQLSDFLYSARKICSEQTITISTNGILLPALSTENWEALRKNRIAIRLSAYPATRDKLKNYIDMIHKNGVDIDGIWDGRKFHIRKKEKYNDDKNFVWETCDAKICHQLYKGKIYTCSFDAYGQFYNQFFNTDFYFVDGIDIYKNDTEHILNYLLNPVRNCSTCDKKGEIITWKLSEYKSDEWDVK